MRPRNRSERIRTGGGFLAAKRDGGGGADHPAIFGAGADELADFVGLRAVPEVFECLHVADIAEAFLPVAFFEAIAGIDFAVGVNEEVDGAGFAGEQAAVAPDVVNQAQIEKGAEPAFGVLFREQAVYQLVEVAGDFFLIGDDVVVFVEII